VKLEAGKELVARAISRPQPSSEAHFVELNCAAIPTGPVAGKELFGHVLKGAFHGGHQPRKIGRLELGGPNRTLFLDEVGDIQWKSKPKLLRALQERGNLRRLWNDPHAKM